MSTTRPDWDQWEAEMPVPPGRLFFASLFLAVAFCATALIGVILGVVTLGVTAGGGYDAPGALAGASGTRRTEAPPTFVPPTLARTAPAPARTRRPVVPLPNLFVATTVDGRLVVSAGGTRTTASVGGQAAGVALTPDGGAALVERWATPDHSDLQWWDLSGTPVAVGTPFAVDGHDPAISPDGRLLAYTEGAAAVPTLVVHDLTDHTEKRWDFPGHNLRQPSWAPDSRSLIVSDVTRNSRRTVFFDTATPEGVVTSQQHLERSYDPITYKGSAGTLVAAGGPAPSGYELVEVDPSTGASRAVYTTPFLVQAIDVDASGEHGLLVTDEAALYVWSNGSIYQVLAGVVDADWTVSR